MDTKRELSTVGGGCFWCLEAIYEQLDGVISVESGYTGGSQPNPTYEEVCSGTTGHVEVVQITFQSSLMTFKEILRVFFSIHDPTTLNRQGNDVGTQYRSAIFYHSISQKETAEAIIEEIETAKVFHDPLATEVVPLEKYYPAEPYHQQYYRRNSTHSYCQFVINPKIAKFRSQYSEKIKNPKK